MAVLLLLRPLLAALLFFSFPIFCWSQQHQYQQQQRQYHPVGNFSANAIHSSVISPRSATPNSQSIYLNLGSIGARQFPFDATSAAVQGQVAAGQGHVIQQRTIYYPCLSRCQPYRWTYRWNTASNQRPPEPPLYPPPSAPAPQPVVQPQPPAPPPVKPVQPQQPTNVHGALIRFVFPSQPNPFQPTLAPSSGQTTSPTMPPTTITTTLATTQQSTTTPAEWTSTIGVGRWLLFIRQTTTNIYELPTPPPYTQNGPGVPDTIVRPNPCPQGQPLMNEFHNPMTCNFVVKPNGGCPEKYWCHTGSSYETTTCCPNVNHKDYCKEPKSIGEGEDLIPRWYYDSGAHKCKRFLYKGMRGNGNNFVTAMSCAESCETAEQAAAVRDPCSNGQPARDLSGQQFKCGVSDSRCPAGYFCHLGELAQANVCCELSAAASDRCNLAVNQGEGSAHLRRFYFNTLTRKCVEFVYRGSKGNENSFLTLDECKATCEKLPNPCPMLFDFGERKECLGESRRCGRGEWCHIGSSKETTACCPAAAVDPCKLPLDLGQGVENLTRWYAIPSDDPCARECRPFQYRGMKGNQNNFPSKTECEATCKTDCPIALNPCSDEEEILLDPEGRPQRCNATGQCPTDYWCHIGANPETTVCCSGVTKACGQPLAEGFGNALLSRWYFNAKQSNCQKFIYRGIGGNQNNYVDYEECMNACPDSVDNQQQITTTPTTSMPTTTKQTTTTTTALEPPNPCGNGKPLTAPDGRPFACSPNRLCPDTHFCHISGQPALSHQCCVKNGDPCDMAPAEGEGYSRLERFYFDPIRRRCRPLLYRGSRGNANNFLSSEDCEYVCAAHLRQNACPHGQPLTDDSGEPLICGNSEAISIPVGVVASGCPNGYWCHVGSSPETTNCCPHLGAKRPCDLPLELGTGTERLDRWYYDEGAQACRRFWYTGLKGNANNFLSRDLCQQTCLQLLINLAAQQQGHAAAEKHPMPEITTRTAPLVNFCLRDEPLVDAEGKLLKCGPENGGSNWNASGIGEKEPECPAQTHFCHFGLTFGTSGCCPKTGSDRCMLPLNRGIGKSTNIRWHFNSATRRCEAFDYAGLRGNENNFLTKKHCEEQCLKRVKKQFCPHGDPKWEGNAQTGLEPVQCGPDKDCPEGFVCHLSAAAGAAICCEDPSHFCLQPRETGPCTENLVRYGYNSLTDTCVGYRYGGCGGTLNQFQTLERCTEICCRQYKIRR